VLLHVRPPREPALALTLCQGMEVGPELPLALLLLARMELAQRLSLGQGLELELELELAQAGLVPLQQPVRPPARTDLSLVRLLVLRLDQGPTLALALALEQLRRRQCCR